MGKSAIKSIFGKGKECATSVDFKVIMRILCELQQTGRTKRTNLAGRTTLNYSRCIRYINLLIILGWVRVFFEDTNYLGITEKGSEVLGSLSNLL